MTEILAQHNEQSLNKKLSSNRVLQNDRFEQSQPEVRDRKELIPLIDVSLPSTSSTSNTTANSAFSNLSTDSPDTDIISAPQDLSTKRVTLSDRAPTNSQYACHCVSCSTLKTVTQLN